MKNLIAIAVSVSALVWFAGCGHVVDGPEIDNSWTSHGRGILTKTVTIENHRYIILDGYRCSGIVHAASCGCVNGGR